MANYVETCSAYIYVSKEEKKRKRELCLDGKPISNSRSTLCNKMLKYRIVYYVYEKPM
jgi:hypothetical protein